MPVVLESSEAIYSAMKPALADVARRLWQDGWRAESDDLESGTASPAEVAARIRARGAPTPSDAVSLAMLDALAAPTPQPASACDEGPVTDADLADFEARATATRTMVATIGDGGPAFTGLNALAHDVLRLVRALREERSAAIAGNELISVLLERPGDDEPDTSPTHAGTPRTRALSMNHDEIERIRAEERAAYTRSLVEWLRSNPREVFAATCDVLGELAVARCNVDFTDCNEAIARAIEAWASARGRAARVTPTARPRRCRPRSRRPTTSSRSSTCPSTSSGTRSWSRWSSETSRAERRSASCSRSSSPCAAPWTRSSRAARPRA